MSTSTFAVQPASFGRFDEWGCEWATDMKHARQLAATFDEDTVIWKCPLKGNPIAIVRVPVRQLDPIS